MSEIHFYIATGKYGFLSNTYKCPIKVDDIKFPSVEHAFQAMKSGSISLTNGGVIYVGSEYSEKIRNTLKSSEAAKLGSIGPIRQDWDVIRYEVMLRLVRAKFTQNPKLASKLKDTDDMVLRETCRNVNCYWGHQSNMLGKILVLVREEL